MERKFSKTSHSRSKPRERQAFPSSARGEYEAYCPHFPNCVGCPFIKVPYPEQLLRKHAIVGRALADYPSLASAEVSPVVASPQRLGYRARVKLVVRKNRDQVAMGLYVPHSHRVMDISSCPVHPRQVNQVVQYLKKKVIELGIAPYDERDDSGDLRYLDFRFSVARHELSMTLVTRHASFPQGAPLAKALHATLSILTGVIQNINEYRGNVIWGRELSDSRRARHVHGAGRRFEAGVSPRRFFASQSFHGAQALRAGLRARGIEGRRNGARPVLRSRSDLALSCRGCAPGLGGRRQRIGDHDR